MSSLRFEPIDVWFKTSFTGKPVDKEKTKKMGATNVIGYKKQKLFVDIWYGLREK
jgi:hypothetical protein